MQPELIHPALLDRIHALAARTGVDPLDIIADAISAKLAELEALNPPAE